jgi:hypothetical protein
MKYCKWEERGRREDVYPGLGGVWSMGPPEWQPSMITTTPCHKMIIMLNFSKSRNNQQISY